MGLKLYYHLLSQPSRTLYILLRASKTPHEAVIVDLAKGENFSPEFAKINRFQKVPCIDHDGFKLSESVAIANYLHRQNMIRPDLYPTDLKTETRLNEFLSWHHIGIRAPCSLFFMAKVLDPMMTGKPTAPEKIEKLKSKMSDALDLLEDKWLGQGHKFLVGDTLTVADVFCSSEIEQPRMGGYDPKVGRPNIAAWMQQIRTELSPYYDEGLIAVDKIAKKHEKKQ